MSYYDTKNGWASCTDVWIHFQAQHAQGVHLSMNDHITAIYKLAVRKWDNTLQIHYLDVKNEVRKIVTYNFDTVLDFSCEGVQTPKE